VALSTAQARGRLGQAVRRHPENIELVERARLELAEATVAAAIKRAVQNAPSLTDEAYERLGLLLRPVRDAA